MPLPRKPPQSRITQAVQTLIRTFNSSTVTIYRVLGHQVTAGKTQGAAITELVYQGEALFAPAGAAIHVLGLGAYQDMSPHLLISGAYPIRQGDETTIDGRTYEVQDAPNRWQAFTVAKLKQTDKRQ
jgi:hypothetical protein